MVNKITILDVLEPFLSQPEEKLHLAEISRQLKQPHPTTRQHLNFLVEHGILDKEVIGRQTFYNLKFYHPLTLDFIQISEKSRLISACKENKFLNELVSFSHEKLSGCDVVIFGSAVEDFNKANDVDVLVIGRKKRPKFPWRFIKPIHWEQVSSLSQITEVFRIELVKKHLLINTSDSLLRWLFCQNYPGAKKRRKG